MAKENGVRNPYQVLEVDPRARQVVITAAHRVLTTVLVDSKQRKDLDEAYDLLSAPDSREEYDRGLKTKVGKMVGPYRLIEMIAEGGFGRTYKAEHAILKEPVCIKDCSNVSPQETWMLIDEARAIWDLRHYAMPAARDLIRLEDGRVALVMSYIPGLTLAQIVEKVGRLPAEHVAWIAERTLNALNYAHHNGVVHGDVKPHNVIVEHEKHMAVLVDWGLSQIKPTSVTKGKGHTPLYAPPEEVSGEPLVPASDYFSLGMTMIFALSGSEEFVEKRKVPKDTPVELCEFIKRLIARDITGRPDWEEEDLGQTIKSVRKKAFGRPRSGMKVIEGL